MFNAGRIIAAAIIGGIVVFAWGAFSHMVLPIGELGLASLPEEERMLAPMKGSITERGFYMFPGTSAHPDEAELKEWEARYKAGPRGVVVYDPSGGPAMGGGQLGSEFASGVGGALVLAIVLSAIGCCWRGAGRAAHGALVGLAMGVFAWLAVDVSYMVWYRFPAMFAAAGLIDQGVGWALAGGVIGLVVKKRECAPCAGEEA